MAASETQHIGVVHPDELYTLSEIKQRLGIRDATLRAARRAGLRVYYAHKNGYVYGRDWIDYVRSSKRVSDGSVAISSSPQVIEGGH
jgi:hypothetical protein